MPAGVGRAGSAPGSGRGRSTPTRGTPGGSLPARVFHSLAAWTAGHSQGWILRGESIRVPAAAGARPEAALVEAGACADADPRRVASRDRGCGIHGMRSVRGRSATGGQVGHADARAAAARAERNRVAPDRLRAVPIDAPHRTAGDHATAMAPSRRVRLDPGGHRRLPAVPPPGGGKAGRQFADLGVARPVRCTVAYPNCGYAAMRRECLPWAISGSRCPHGIRAVVRTVELSVFLYRGCGGSEYRERRDVRLARELAELTGDTPDRREREYRLAARAPGAGAADSASPCPGQGTARDRAALRQPSATRALRSPVWGSAP